MCCQMAVMIGSQMLGLANRSSSDFDADTAEQLYSAILQSFVIISLYSIKNYID